ncbi:MAG: hypothetical protein B1H03_02665 [Planctomycetales bacterium 4484_113]|nr:MAG: hypothetical protein B1H03_02665 [Planctomycetales bacterium 4484_113]
MEELRVSFGRDVPRGKEVLAMAAEIVKATPSEAPAEMLQDVVRVLVELIEADLHPSDEGTFGSRL